MLLFEPDGDILPHNGEDICEWFNGGVTVEPDAVAASACGADIDLGEQLEKHRFTSSKSLVVVAVVDGDDDDEDDEWKPFNGLRPILAPLLLPVKDDNDVNLDELRNNLVFKSWFSFS